jgi:raffinose/stachyose/melibiose transport system permease protein
MSTGDANLNPAVSASAADRRTARGRRAPFRWGNVALYVVLTAFMLLVIVPFLSISLAALKTPEELVQSTFALPSQWRWSNYAEAWQQAHFNRYFVNSIVVALPVVAVSTLLSVLSGYAFGRFSFPLRGFLFILFLIGIMAPQEAYIISLYYLMDRMGLIDTYWAMILPQIGMSVCFGTFWMRGYFEGVPGDMIDAARVDGCNSFSVLWRVIMPNAGAAVSTLVVLIFLWTWNDFLVPLVLTTSDMVKTLPLGLAFFQGRYQANVPLIAAGATIVALPTILVYIMFQRKFIQGITSGSVRG